MKYTCTLENLDCAHCAQKIEQKITEVCRECGWTAPLTFDTYSDELVW